jgi:CheY-like chemotaxis protein
LTNKLIPAIVRQNKVLFHSLNIRKIKMSKRYVLLVEDDKPFSDILKIAIEELGSSTEVLQALDLNKGFVLLDRYRGQFLCIILGGELSFDTTTLSLAQKIKSLDITSECPVISFSGNPELQLKQMQAGCTHEFKKIEVREMFFFIRRLK